MALDTLTDPNSDDPSSYGDDPYSEEMAIASGALPPPKVGSKSPQAEALAKIPEDTMSKRQALMDAYERLIEMSKYRQFQSPQQQGYAATLAQYDKPSAAGTFHVGNSDLATLVNSSAAKAADLKRMQESDINQATLGVKKAELPIAFEDADTKKLKDTADIGLQNARANYYNGTGKGSGTGSDTKYAPIAVRDAQGNIRYATRQEVLDDPTLQPVRGGTHNVTGTFRKQAIPAIKSSLGLEPEDELDPDLGEAILKRAAGEMQQSGNFEEAIDNAIGAIAPNGKDDLVRTDSHLNPFSATKYGMKGKEKKSEEDQPEETISKPVELKAIATSKYKSGQTAVNPKTGEKLVFREGKWRPLLQ